MATCSIDLVNLSVTGDCSNTNSGAFSFNIIGTNPGFSIYWVYPSGGTTVALTGPSYIYTVNGLSAGTYTFEVHDSSSPTNCEITHNIYISSGTCISLGGHKNTSCGLSNGVLTAQTASVYDTSYFYLYSTTKGYIKSGSSISTQYVFNSLSADTYYVIGNDGGGCTGSSETCIVKSSTTLNYGLYVVNNSACVQSPGSGVGKIYITGLTGTSPFTYLWSNGQTTSSITGLTSGSYSVTVTDATGCSAISGATVGNVGPVGILNFQTITAPTCSGGNGEIKATITGGTAPYYYNLSNGFNVISFNQTYNFTGLSAGLYTLTVTDSALCTTTQTYALQTPGSFSVIQTLITNATCQGNNGSIDLELLNGTPPINIQLSGVNSTFIYNYNPPSNGGMISINIPNIAPGNYNLEITDAAATCTSVQNITVGSTSTFSTTTLTTGTTCSNNNGVIEVVVTGGVGPYTYEIEPLGDIETTTATTYYFTGLASNTYTITVNDSSTPPCYQTLSVSVNGSNGPQFTLIGTNPVTGNDGSIYPLITDGVPPFTYLWSDSSTSNTLSNLGPGTYSLTITDASGCTGTSTTTLVGYSTSSTYGKFNICDSTFQYAGQGVRGIFEMANQGFQQNFGSSACTVTAITYTAIVSVSGVSASTLFYSANTITDYPSDELWGDALQTLFSGYTGITNTIVDVETNSLLLQTVCSTTANQLAFANVKTNLKIDYYVSCNLGPQTCYILAENMPILSTESGNLLIWNPNC